VRERPLYARNVDEICAAAKHGDTALGSERRGAVTSLRAFSASVIIIYVAMRAPQEAERENPRSFADARELSSRE